MESKTLALLTALLAVSSAFLMVPLMAEDSDAASEEIPVCGYSIPCSEDSPLTSFVLRFKEVYPGMKDIVGNVIPEGANIVDRYTLGPVFIENGSWISIPSVEGYGYAVVSEDVGLTASNGNISGYVDSEDGNVFYCSSGWNPQFCMTVYFVVVEDEVPVEITSDAPYGDDLFPIVGSTWSHYIQTNVDGAEIQVTGADWLTVNGNELIGTPSADDQNTVFTVTVTALGETTSDTQTFRLTVKPVLSFESRPTGWIEVVPS